MKFNITKKDLTRVLDLCSSLASVEPWVQITGNKGYVTFNSSGAHGDIVLRVETPSLTEDFTRIVSYRSLISVVGMLNDEIEISDTSQNSSDLKLKSGKSYFKIPAAMNIIPPPIAYFNKETVKVHDVTQLLTALSKVGVISMKEDQPHYFLRGVHVMTKDKKLFVETCDGSNMCRAECFSLGSEMDVLVDSGGMQLLKKFLKDIKEVSLFAGENFLQLKTSEGALKLRLIVGKFPPLDKVILTQFDHAFSVDADSFREVIKKAACFAEEGTIDLVIKDTTVISVEISSHLGEFIERFEAMASLNMESKIGSKLRLSAPHLVRFLQSFPDGVAEIGWCDNTTQVCIKNKAGDVIYITAQSRGSGEAAGTA